MYLVLSFALLITGSLAAPASQSLTFHDDGSYQFFYETGKDGGSHSRTESRNPDGVVVGKFSYEDPTGEIREVNYRADGTGYVAKGDVSVIGAPKGQFPFVPSEHQTGTLPEASHQEQAESQGAKTEAGADLEEVQEKSQNLEVPSQELQDQPTEDQENTQEPEATSVESHQDEKDKDEMKDLTLEESTVDGPPEAFPQGFFLQNFQGLRRLRDPPKEEEPAKEESSAEGRSDESAAQEGSEVQPPQSSQENPNEARFFVPLKPFPNFNPQQWASQMFHQPVYVFSYQQPDSYGYHYFF